MLDTISVVRRPALSAHARERLTLWLMLAPFLAGSVLLILVPAVLALGLAFTRYDGLSAPEWFGLGNYRRLLAEPLFWIALRNSLCFALLVVPLRLALALALALLLRGRRRGAALYRVGVYLPTVVPSAAYALVWLWVLNPLYGPLNMLLGLVGAGQPAWLADPRMALPAVALAALFQLGEGFVVLLAGLREIPVQYYEAATIDGAGRLATLRYLTLPLLMPWLMLVLLRDLIVSVQSSFVPALLMTGGGPDHATLFLPLLQYETAFDRLRFGEGAAITLVELLLVGVLVLAMLGLRGWGYADDV